MELVRMQGTYCTNELLFFYLKNTYGLNYTYEYAEI